MTKYKMAPADELLLLTWLCPIVGARFSEQASCIPATALMVAVAAELGIALRPQPVSIWSGDSLGQSATGTRAKHFGLSMGGTIRRDSVADSVDPWFREVGHLVAVSDEHRVMLDATYSQFRRPRAPRPIVMPQIPKQTGKEDEAWSLQVGEWHVRYWPVDYPTSWESQYAAARELIVPRYLSSLVDGAASLLAG